MKISSAILCLTLLAAVPGLAFAAETRMTDAQIQQKLRRTATPMFRSPTTTKTIST